MSNNYVYFFDFDGTITTKDTIYCITKNVLSEEIVQIMDEKVFSGEITNNELLFQLLSNLTISLDSAIKYIMAETNNRPIDSTFQYIYNNAKNNSSPIYIISDNMRPIINLLMPFVDNNYIYCNDLQITDNGWDITFAESKKERINKIMNQHIGYKTLYVGDGVSDIPVASFVDKLYVKKGKMLEKYCKLNNIDHEIFNTMDCVLEKIKRLDIFS